MNLAGNIHKSQVVVILTAMFLTEKFKHFLSLKYNQFKYFELTDTIYYSFLQTLNLNK